MCDDSKSKAKRLLLTYLDPDPAHSAPVGVAERHIKLDRLLDLDGAGRGGQLRQLNRADAGGRSTACHEAVGAGCAYEGLTRARPEGVDATFGTLGLGLTCRQAPYSAPNLCLLGQKS